MDNLDMARFLALLAVMFAAAKLFGALAQRIGQPAVLGELVAGVILGAVAVWCSTAIGCANPFHEKPQEEILHLLAEIGVVILLFEIGLETDLLQLLRVGGAAMTVAVVGVILPFGMGFGVCWLLGYDTRVAIVAGASLTATSVGITARVLSDLGRLQDLESQIILGAAVIDDVIGLVILTVVAGVTGGNDVGFWDVLIATGIAIGFLVATLLLGNRILPLVFRLARKIDLPGTATMVAVMIAFTLAWLAKEAGSAVIIGAFAAGLLLTRVPQARGIEQGVAHLGHFFVPLFFVTVGTEVDVKVFNPLNPDNRPVLMIGGLLIFVAVAGKFLAGYAPFWLRARKSVIGVGMVPRGEVGLIFARLGRRQGVFDAGLFSAVTVMVMATTFLAPPLLRLLLPRRPAKDKAREPTGIEDLTTNA